MTSAKDQYTGSNRTSSGTSFGIDLIVKRLTNAMPALAMPRMRFTGLPEALASAQVKQRGFVQKTEDGIEVPTLPFRLGDAKTYTPTSRAPTLGEHTKEIVAWLDS